MAHKLTNKIILAILYESKEVGLKKVICDIKYEVSRRNEGHELSLADSIIAPLTPHVSDLLRISRGEEGMSACQTTERIARCAR